MNAKQESYAKILRQSIMAIAIKKYGWNYDQFHEIMQEWGFGKSLRKLNIPELKDLKNQLNGIKSDNAHDIESDNAHCRLRTTSESDNAHCRLQTTSESDNAHCRLQKEWQLDEQGKLMWFLMKSIGWNQKRITSFMIKKYRKSHWNLLIEPEKRGVINMLRSYKNRLNK